MPPMLQTAQLPRRDRENTDSERFVAEQEAPPKSKSIVSLKDRGLFESRPSGKGGPFPAQANSVFQSLLLPRLASQGYSYHTIYRIRIRLQDCERLLPARIMWRVL
jgi:hypothetical protein